MSLVELFARFVLLADRWGRLGSTRGFGAEAPIRSAQSQKYGGPLSAEAVREPNSTSLRGGEADEAIQLI